MASEPVEIAGIENADEAGKSAWFMGVCRCGMHRSRHVLVDAASHCFPCDAREVSGVALL